MADKDKGTALNWGDEAEVQNGGDFELLPAGEYAYEVVNFKRERYDGGPNMGPCPVAVLQLRCANSDASIAGTVFERLFLNSKVLFRITNFFKSAGLLDPNAEDGSSMSMALFDKAIGCTGRCKVKVRKYRVDGQEREANDVDFIVPKAEPAPQAQRSWGGQGF